MSFALFHKALAGAIGTLFDKQSQPMFKRVDKMLEGGNNPHGIFINLDGYIEIAVRSKKPQTVTVTSW